METENNLTTPPSQSILRVPQSLSIVVPCYNEEAVLEVLCRRLSAVLDTFALPYEVILIDDGSSDRTWELMRQCRARYRNLKLTRLARNCGQQLALTCGLDQARGQVTIVIDADLQDPPELFPEMINLWGQGYDVVYGQRRLREGEPISKRLFAFCFYRLFSKLAGFRLPPDTGDFRLLDRRVLDALSTLRERHRFLRGMVTWVGFRQTALLYSRPPRLAGSTKYPFVSSLRLALDAIFSFSFLPLRLALIAGMLCFGAGLGGLAMLAVRAMLGVSTALGWQLLAPTVFLAGVQLLAVGVLGEYIGRIFETNQNRPLYIIDAIEGEPLLDRAADVNGDRVRNGELHVA